MLRHYLTPFVGDWYSLHFLESSNAPQQHPETTLELLWVICGQGSRGQSTELGKILDRIVVVRPALETDRRLQWLQQKAVRYG